MTLWVLAKRLPPALPSFKEFVTIEGQVWSNPVGGREKEAACSQVALHNASSPQNPKLMTRRTGPASVLCLPPIHKPICCGIPNERWPRHTKPAVPFFPFFPSFFLSCPIRVGFRVAHFPVIFAAALGALRCSGPVPRSLPPPRF